MPRPFLTPNEQRQSLGLGPVDGGDRLPSVTEQASRMARNIERVESAFAAALLANLDIPSITAQVKAITRATWPRQEAEREVDAFLRGERYEYQPYPE